MLKMQRYGLSFNLDGLWSGNIVAGGAGAILPNKITSKHNMRYVPKMNGLEDGQAHPRAARSQRLQGRRDKIICDVPWSKMSYDTDIARAMTDAYAQFNIPHGEPAHYSSILGGTGRRISSPTRTSASGSAGVDADRHGRRRPRRQRAPQPTSTTSSKAPEGLRHGGRRESAATIIYNFAGKNKPAAAPKATNHN